METGLECILSRFAKSTKLRGAVYSLEGWVSLQRSRQSETLRRQQPYEVQKRETPDRTWDEEKLGTTVDWGKVAREEFSRKR